MLKNRNDQSEAETVRQKAEEFLKEKSEAKILQLIEELSLQNEEKAMRVEELSVASANALKLTHELVVHQIELETLNIELILAKERADEAAEKYAELYDNAPTGYFILSKEGNIIELNLIGASMLGKERRLLKSSRFGFFVSNDTKPAFSLFLDKTFSSQTRETCDVTLVSGGNTPVYIHLTGIVNENREQCLVTTVDITGQKLAEDALKVSEKKFRTVADNTYDWEYWQGADGRIIYISPSCERISGYKPEEFLSDNSLLEKITHPGDATLFSVYSEHLHSPEHKNRIDEFDFRLLKKDGSVAHIGHINRPVFDEKGNYEGRRISNRDITGRKQMEEELKLGSVRLELAARAGGVGVWDYDIVNDILVWDDQMFALYGIARKDFIGVYQAWQDGLHPKDKERGDNEFQMALRGEKDFDIEFLVVWPDGSVHNIRALAVIQRDDSGIALRIFGTNWDITELRKAEKEKLDDSENRYRSIFYGSPDGIMITDEQTERIIFANPSQCEMLGYSEEELETMTMSMIYPEVSFPADFTEFEKQAGGEDNFPNNVKILKKNGDFFYADIKPDRITINGRKCKVGFFRDITKRRHAEEMLLKSEELYRSLVSNSSDLLIISDEKGITTFCGPQCEKVVGYHASKFIGQMMPDIIHPADVDRCKQAWSEVFNDGFEIRDFEYRIIDENGGVRWMSHTVNMITVNNKLMGIQNTIRNITDRKMAENAIRLSEEKYKTMLNASPEGIVLINLNGIITEISEIGIPLFGENSRDDIIGKDIAQFVSPEESDIFRELLAKTTNEGFTQNIKLTVKKKDQSVFAGEISTTLMQEQDGAPISFMLIVRDVSQRNKIEAKQIHSDRMSTLGEMAAGIAHEINQPLNIISMVMDKILFETNRTEIVDVEFLKIKSEKIFENITRMRDIIDHVRTFSRRQDDFIPIAFDINSSIVNASSMIVEQFKHNGISLNLHLEPHIPQILGNTNKFEQVIINLLANAKDAVTEMKTQRHDAEMLIGIRTWKENQNIMVEVTDNGSGISEDDIHNIMLPFYTTKDEGKGTGLGLSICYQIIKEMNGNIEVVSEKFVGTKIKLVLPVQNKK